MQETVKLCKTMRINTWNGDWILFHQYTEKYIGLTNDTEEEIK